MELVKVVAYQNDYSEINELLRQGYILHSIVQAKDEHEIAYLLGPCQIGPSETKEGREFLAEIQRAGFLGSR